MDCLQDSAMRPPWLFTTDSAKANAKKSADLRKRQAQALKEKEQASQAIVDQSDNPRRQRILEQIDALDLDFKDASAELRVKITASKARLWELLYPKPGSLRPRSEKASRSRPSEPEPMPEDCESEEHQQPKPRPYLGPENG